MTVSSPYPTRLVKVEDLKGVALSYAVGLLMFPNLQVYERIARVIDLDTGGFPHSAYFLPHLLWQDCGQLIDKWKVMPEPGGTPGVDEWAAHIYVPDEGGGKWRVCCAATVQEAVCLAVTNWFLPSGEVEIPEMVLAAAENKLEAPEHAAKPPQQRVVCAAMRCRKSGKIIASVRHWDSICHQAFASKEEAINDFDDEQGFLDNRWNFLTRAEAWKVALAAGQIIRRCGGDLANGGTLYSENLY